MGCRSVSPAGEMACAANHCAAAELSLGAAAAMLSRDVMQDFTSATSSSRDWPRIPLAATCSARSSALNSRLPQIPA